MKAITPITISTKRAARRRRKTRDSMRVRRAARAICILVRLLRATQRSAWRLTQFGRPKRYLRPMSNRQRSQSNRAQLWQIIAFPTKPYAKFVLWISLYGLTHALWNCVRNKFLASRATVLPAIIRTSPDIYWHSVSLRKANSFVLATCDCRKSSNRTPPTADKGL